MGEQEDGRGTRSRTGGWYDGGIGGWAGDRTGGRPDRSEQEARRGEDRSQSKDGFGVYIVASKEKERERTSKKKRQYIERA